MSHRSYWTLIIPILLLMLLGTGCEEDTTTGPGSSTPVIIEWELPAKMAYNSLRTDRIVVVVEDAQGPANLQTMQATILSGSTVIDTFSLLDDGSQYTVTPHPPWATEVSGDLIPLDGFFSRRISGQFVDQPTQVTFRFEVVDNDGHVAQPLEVAVEVRTNTAPVLDDLQLLDTLESGFGPLTLSVRAVDPDDLDYVTLVWLDVLGSGKGELELSGPDAENRWSLEIDSSFAAGIREWYIFKFYAEDTFHEISNPISRQVYVENEHPTTFNLDMPDTMYIPPDSTTINYDELYIDVSDPQSLLDIQQVYFTALYVDSNRFSGPFNMFDTGELPDLVAGDGTYTSGIRLEWDNDPGRYDFTYVAEDRVGQESVPVTQTMWVLPSPAGLSNAPSTPNWLPPPVRNDRTCNPFQTERRDR